MQEKNNTSKPETTRPSFLAESCVARPRRLEQSWKIIDLSLPGGIRSFQCLQLNRNSCAKDEFGFLQEKIRLQTKPETTKPCFVAESYVARVPGKLDATSTSCRLPAYKPLPGGIRSFQCLQMNSNSCAKGEFKLFLQETEKNKGRRVESLARPRRVAGKLED